MDTSLRTLVLSGKLKQPIQKGFSREAWDAALRAINRPSDEDREIHRAALFFASQLDGLRLVLDQNPAAPGSPESRVRRAIGFINRDHKVLEQALESSRSSVRPTGNAVPLTEILQFEVDLSSGNRIGPQQLIESAVDGLRFELAKQNDGRTSQNSVGDHALAIRRTYLRLNLSVFYHLLEEEWRESLYSGLRVVDTENGLTTLRPTDTHAAEAQAIGMYRSTAIDLEFATHAASMFRGSKASAIEGIRGIVQRGSGRNARYQVSELKSESAAAVLVPRALAIEPDLAPFMSEPLEGFSMLTPTELLSAWSAVATLGRHIGGRLELVDIHSVQDFERLAPIVKLRDLLPAIARCTELPREKCQAAVEAMIWRDVRDSIWHRPLIRLNSTSVVPVLPALISPNLRRSIEYWLKEGGFDLGDRGEHYENYVRQSLRSYIERNALLKCAGSLAHKAVPSDLKAGDIDVFFWIGSTIVVAEVKCFLRPATEHEFFLYESKITEAARQAQVKAGYVRSHPTWVDDVTAPAQIPTQDRRVIPCVILNSPLGALRAIEATPIVDLHILRRYLREGFGLYNSLSNDPGSGERVPFYRTCHEAEERLDSFLKSPDYLQMYRQPLEWRLMYQPDFQSHGGVVARAYPAVAIKAPSSKDGALGDQASADIRTGN